MRRIHDLHDLPKTSDGWSHLYVEHCRIDQEAHGVALHDQRGMLRVPCAMLSTLMIGPGVSITSAAVRTLADHGCSIVWVGEDGVRLYASGMGETRSSRRLLHQARCYVGSASRLEVAVRLYRMRFDEALAGTPTIEQLRGMEGARVRQAYAVAAEEWGVEWHGRAYQRGHWNAADPINRALSTANSCLYGICHAAIVAAGYSPGLGFIHTGRMLAFVYDIADLYKTSTALPAAFAAVAESNADLESRVRRICREAFYVERLLNRIVADIAYCLDIRTPEEEDVCDGADFAAPGDLWDASGGTVPGGANYA